MRRILAHLLSAALIMALPSIANADPAPAPEPSLFTWLAEERSLEPGFLSERTGHVDPDAFSELSSTRFIVDFGLRRTFGITFEPMVSGSDAAAWRGTIDGYDEAGSFLVRHGDSVSGSITTPTATFVVQSAGPRLVKVLEVDQDLPGGTEAEPLTPPTSAGDAPARPSLRSTVTIDVLVIYSPDARTAMGGEAAAQDFAEDRIAELNTAFSNSGINAIARLAHASVVSYTETGNSGTDLNNLTYTGDGILEEAHTLRDEHGADIVTLLTATGGSIAWVMTNVSPSFAPWAFNVVTVGMAGTNKSMSHEIGHNLGSAHDWENASVPGAYPYSYGHRVPGAFRTIMSYPCSFQNQANCPRVLHFSNPTVQFGGTDTGVAGGLHPADNGTGFNTAAATVAAFRPSSVTYCMGEIVTISGTSGKDTIVGTNSADVIEGLGGNDTIDGLGGDDIICGGGGSDTIRGGGGNDKVAGGAGNDKLYGDNGNDWLMGQGNNDTLEGGRGNDTLDDGSGDDIVRGDGGRDVLRPGPGTDTLIGGSSKDYIDFVFAQSGVTIDLMTGVATSADLGTETVSEVEHVRGSDQADFIYGNGMANRLTGRAGDDLLMGKGGNDLIIGKGGNDNLLGSSGADTLRGGSGTDSANGGRGNDTCEAETTVGCE